MQYSASPEEVSKFVESMQGSTPYKHDSPNTNIHACTEETLFGQCGGTLIQTSVFHYQCMRCKMEHFSKTEAEMFIVSKSVLDKTAISRRKARWCNVKEKKISHFSRDYGGRVS